MANAGDAGPTPALPEDGKRAQHGALGAAAPPIARFLRYWRDACGDRAMPRRCDVDPLEVPAGLLPCVILTDALEGGAQHRYRLVGTGIEMASRRSLTGGIVGDAIPNPAYRAYVLGLYATVMARRRPLFSVSNFAHPELHHIVTERIMCPLSEDGATVSMILTCQVFDAHPDRWRDAAHIAPGEFQQLVEAEVV
jgi:hypothetical protein